MDQPTPLTPTPRSPRSFVSVAALLVAILALILSSYAIFQIKEITDALVREKILGVQDFLRPRRRPSPTPTPKPSPTPTSTPSPVPAGAGLPFGPFHLPTTSYGTPPYTGAFLDLSKYTVANAAAALEGAKVAKVKLIVTLGGGGSSFSDSANRYSYTAFQSVVDKFSSLDLTKYYNDGVVLGNLIMDEPQDPNNWGGQTVTLTQIKQAAQYVKSRWPTVPVGVGSSPSFLKGGGWSAEDLDFVSVPFTENKLSCKVGRVGCYGSTVDQWIAGVVADAKANNLGVATSINVINGGTPNGTEMTSANLQKYGTLFVSQSSACVLTLWKWDTAYFSRSDVQSVLSAIATVAKTHAPKACRPN